MRPPTAHVRLEREIEKPQQDGWQERELDPHLQKVQFIIHPIVMGTEDPGNHQGQKDVNCQSPAAFAIAGTVSQMSSAQQYSNTKECYKCCNKCENNNLPQ